ncbi:MAG TPA: hypothetical protein VGB14_00475 [Acidimicrobiales bacterium]|jgi:hypothetical protein
MTRHRFGLGEWFVLVAAAALAVLAFLAPAAGAQELAPPGEVVSDGGDYVLFNLDLTVLALVLGTVLPMLVSVATAKLASPAVKQLTLVALAAAAALVEGAVAGGGVFTLDAVVGFVVTFGWAVLAYFGVHRGTTDPAIQSAIPGGIGAPRVRT